MTEGLSRLTSQLASHAWAYPALEAAHIAGIAVLLGSLLLFELRVWGIGIELPVQALGRVALRLSLAGFGLAALSGITMFATQPGELLANRAFQVKVGLLLVAGLNAIAFHWRGGAAKLDAAAKAQTAISVGLWLAIIICGRWIAYV